MPRFNISVPVVHSFQLNAVDAEAAMQQAEDMIEGGRFGDDYEISGTAATEIEDIDVVDDGESEIEIDR